MCGGNPLRIFLFIDKEENKVKKYRVICEGEVEEEFDTEDEALDYIMEMRNAYDTGAEVLHLSRPLEYSEEGYGQLDYYIEEIEE